MRRNRMQRSIDVRAISRTCSRTHSKKSRFSTQLKQKKNRWGILSTLPVYGPVVLRLTELFGNSISDFLSWFASCVLISLTLRIIIVSGEPMATSISLSSVIKENEKKDMLRAMSQTLLRIDKVQTHYRLFKKVLFNMIFSIIVSHLHQLQSLQNTPVIEISIALLADTSAL